MNLALLLPTALLALSSLLIPLLIHLGRRSEQKPTDFAALRWISAQLRPRRKLVFQEILLLLLRLLLVIVLVVFLAKPVAMQSSSHEQWGVVVPGADIDAAKNLFVKQENEWHWLSPGFPDFKEKPVAVNIPISSLLRELDARLPANTTLTVVVPEQLSGLDGEHIRLSRKVDWKIVPGKMSAMPTPENTKTIRLAIRQDEKHADAAIYFRAVHTSWQSELKAEEKTAVDSSDISSPIKSEVTALVWLADGELPAGIREWTNKGGTLLVSKDSVVPEIKSSVAAWRNGQGTALVLAAPLGKGRILQWQQDLKPAAIPELLDVDFPEHLRSLLQSKPSAPTQALANFQTPLVGAKASPETPQSLQIWLALLVALLLLIERWLANSSRRWTAA
ncbi:MAG: BatA domain-containing protein [Arenimonas sp.]